MRRSARRDRLPRFWPTKPTAHLATWVPPAGAGEFRHCRAAMVAGDICMDARVRPRSAPSRRARAPPPDTASGSAPVRSRGRPQGHRSVFRIEQTLVAGFRTLAWKQHRDEGPRRRADRGAADRLGGKRPQGGMSLGCQEENPTWWSGPGAVGPRSLDATGSAVKASSDLLGATNRVRSAR